METVSKYVVCRYCQTEIRAESAWLTGEECWDCWIEPYCIDAYWEDYLQRLADGTLPERFIGC